MDSFGQHSRYVLSTRKDHGKPLHPKHSTFIAIFFCFSLPKSPVCVLLQGIHDRKFIHYAVRLSDQHQTTKDLNGQPMLAPPNVQCIKDHEKSLQNMVKFVFHIAKSPVCVLLGNPRQEIYIIRCEIMRLEQTAKEVNGHP